MAIIVNKEEKRRSIALASKSLLLEHGIKNITISKIAECAGVGKGTIYEYFSNKEDIVFEIISVFITELEKHLYELIKQDMSTKEKIKTFLTLLYSDACYEKQLVLYREYLAISLTSDVEAMTAFSKACRERFLTILDQIIEDGIEKDQINVEAKAMVGTVHTFAIGLVVESKINGLDAKIHIDEFVEALFTLIQKKDIS
jgi:AcrR family transcriptional regulator